MVWGMDYCVSPTGASELPGLQMTAFFWEVVARLGPRWRKWANGEKPLGISIRYLLTIRRKLMNPAGVVLSFLISYASTIHSLIPLSLPLLLSTLSAFWLFDLPWFKRGTL